MKVSGVYLIVNTTNGHQYVGSSVDLYTRRVHHFSDLRGRRHRNAHLQRAFDYYGEESFKWSVLEECDAEDLIIREQYYINSLKPEYNILPNAYSFNGYHHTDDTREKIGLSSRTRERRRWTQDEKDEQSRRMIGKTYPNKEEQIKKIVAKTKGKKRSIESILRYIKSKLGNEYGAKEYTLESPSGEIIKVKNLRAYCRQNGIDYHIRERKQWKGWKLHEDN